MSEVQESTLTQVNETLKAAQTSPLPPSVWNEKSAFDQMLRASQMLAQSKLVPQAFQGSPQDCFIAIEIASRVRTSPIMVMQNLSVIKGKPGWSGQACISFINTCGKYKDAEYVYVGEPGTDDFGCYVQAKRISDGKIIKGTTVKMSLVKGEGWISNSKWRTMPEQMLAYRSAVFFARMYCPESLVGLQTIE